MDQTLAIDVTEVSQVGEARRLAASLSRRLAFGAVEAGALALVVTELATNLTLHAVRGQLLLRPLEASGRVGVEVISLDRGPGMSSVERCLEDGFSTAGTSGNGLGAVSRLSGSFEAYSVPKSGTAIVARVWAQGAAGGQSRSLPPHPLVAGFVRLPYPGQEICGDEAAVVSVAGTTRIMVADGLGHGPAAAEASQEAARIFRENPDLPPVALIDAAHCALRSTRGAAMAVAWLDADRAEVRFAGIGNISAVLVAPDLTTQSLVSLNGTVGFQLRKVAEFRYSWPPGGVLVMHSDGLAARWRLDQYPGLIAHNPALIAATLYRDFSRARDDLTVLVVRLPSAEVPP